MSNTPVEDLEKDQGFEDTAEWEKFFAEYQKRTFQCFSKGKTDFRKDKNGSTIQGEYDRLNYKCHRGTKEYVRQSTGERPFQQTFRNECPAVIRLSYHKNRNQLVLTSFVLDHNHPLSGETFKQLPAQRRLDAATKLKALDMLKTGSSVSAVTKTLRLETSKEVQYKDIHNLHGKDKTRKRAGKTELEVLRAVFDEARSRNATLEVSFSSDPATEELDVMYFSTGKMRNSYRM